MAFRRLSTVITGETNQWRFVCPAFGGAMSLVARYWFGWSGRPMALAIPYDKSKHNQP